MTYKIDKHSDKLPVNPITGWKEPKITIVDSRLYMEILHIHTEVNTQDNIDPEDYIYQRWEDIE